MTAVPVPTDFQTEAKPVAKAASRFVPTAGGVAPNGEIDGRNSYAVTAVADIIDRSLHATIARFTLGLSPAALSKAYFDWAIHLAVSPGKRLQLVDKAHANRSVSPITCSARRRAAARHRAASSRCRRTDASTARIGKSRRTIHGAVFLLQQQWWHNATTGIRGVTKHHEERVEFVSRQMLDMVSPSNFLPTNPEVCGRRSAKAA